MWGSFSCFNRSGIFQNKARSSHCKERYKTEQVSIRPNKTTGVYRQVGGGHGEVPEANENILRKCSPFYSPVRQSHKHGQTHNPTSKIQNRQRGIWKQHMSSPVPFDLA